MLASVPMTFHAAHDKIRNSFFVMVFGKFGLVVAIEAGKAARARWMAGGAHAIRAIMVNREGMVEVGWEPTAGTVAIGALPAEVVRRPAVNVAALTIHCASHLMIERRTNPGCSCMAG